MKSFPLDKPVEKLIVRAIASDGGTAYAEAVVEGEDGWQFYIDGRIGSETKGELFLDYPNDKSSDMIEPNSIFLTLLNRSGIIKILSHNFTGIFRKVLSTHITNLQEA